MYDVLIVGGGPAGAAAAIGLAGRGHRVAIVERDRMPRQKTCGDLLTPRGVAAVAAVGLDAEPLGHRVAHVRLTFADADQPRSTSTTWPDTALPDGSRVATHALVVPRQRLDAELIALACGRGAELLDGHTAIAPIVTRGFVRGARVSAPDGRTLELASTYTVVADGANSRFGRALGTFREPTWPHGVAHRARYRSALHDAAEVELVVGLRDRGGVPITGFAWMYPRGDGTVNVGVTVMSTSPSFKVISVPRLLDAVATEHATEWHLDGAAVEPPAGGRIPMGASVGPAAGPTYLVVGDAAGVANPLSGLGVEYAIETGRLAGEVLAEALDTGASAALQRYPRLLDETYGTYFKVGRLGSRLFRNTQVNQRLTRLAASRRPVADALLRLAADQLRPGWGSAELAYRVGRAIALVAPNS